MTITNTELAQAVNRVADIVEESTKRYGIYRDGRARIHPRIVLNAMFDLAPETYFENGSGMEKWRAVLPGVPEGRHAGPPPGAARRGLGHVHRAAARGLARGGTYYTPEQIRDIARSLTKE